MKTICVVTRCHQSRPNMFKVCEGSLKKQTADDYAHLLVKDTKGYGVNGANEALHTAKPIDGRYVMVLDDDDFLIDMHFVEEFKKRVDRDKPDIVMFKGVIPPFGILPPESLWEKPPERAWIGSFCFAVSKEFWEKYILSWKPSEGYAVMGDFTFIRECFKNAKKVVWMDRIVACTQDGSNRGKGEV